MLRRIREFLWFCAGVEASIARKVTTGSTALASVGATILATAFLAFLSGSYALYFVFESRPLAISVGLFWAGIIFNLDRFLVSSLQRRGELVEDILRAAPRFAMAILISVVIVVPIELRLFEEEINDKVPEQRLEQQRNFVAVLDASYQTQIDLLTARIAAAQAEILQWRARRDSSLQDPETAHLREEAGTLSTMILKLEDETRT